MAQRGAERRDEQTMLTADRRMYEKILFANYLMLDSWDGQKYRQTLDRCLAWVLSPEDTKTAAYLQYEYLRGRDEDFVGFLKETLGVTDDASTKVALQQRYGARAAPAIAAAKARGGF